MKKTSFCLIALLQLAVIFTACDTPSAQENHKIVPKEPRKIVLNEEDKTSGYYLAMEPRDSIKRCIGFALRL